MPSKRYVPVVDFSSPQVPAHSWGRAGLGNALLALVKSFWDMKEKRREILSCRKDND